MPLTVRQFACLNDNYGFLVRDEATGEVAAIDAPDADAILGELSASGWDRLDLVLNTHWHADHAGGDARLKAERGAAVVAPAEVARVTPVDRIVEGGETVALGRTVFEVLAVPGHTAGHIAYLARADGVVFVGDTLFALGCGRLFEGTAEEMWASLSTLAALPEETRVYCAHEYTASNARFALSLGADAALEARAGEVFAARERGLPTVPTTIGLERRTNPFLKAGDAAEFARLRAAKDVFRG